MTVEGQPRPQPGQEIISDYRVMTAGYFEAAWDSTPRRRRDHATAGRLFAGLDQSDDGASRLARAVGHRSAYEADELRSRWWLVHRRGHRRRYAIHRARSCAAAAGVCALSSGSEGTDGSRAPVVRRSDRTRELRAVSRAGSGSESADRESSHDGTDCDHVGRQSAVPDGADWRVRVSWP